MWGHGGRAVRVRPGIGGLSCRTGGGHARQRRERNLDQLAVRHARGALRRRDRQFLPIADPGHHSGGNRAPQQCRRGFVSRHRAGAFGNENALLDAAVNGTRIVELGFTAAPGTVAGEFWTSGGIAGPVGNTQQDVASALLAPLGSNSGAVNFGLNVLVNNTGFTFGTGACHRSERHRTQRERSMGRQRQHPGAPDQ